MPSLLPDDLRFDADGVDDERLEPDYRAAFESYRKTPGPQTRGALLRSVKPVLDRAVSSYAPGWPGAMGHARAMALKAFDTYDPARGTMRTHLLTNLQHLRRVNSSVATPIPVPERLALDRVHLLSAEDELRDRLGREPGTLELADHTGLSLRRIAAIRRAAPPMNERGIVLDGTELQPASAIPGVDLADEMAISLVYGDLAGADQLIMDHTLGMHGRQQLSVSAIAAKLGVTPAAISQRKAKIQRQLDTLRGFAER